MTMINKQYDIDNTIKDTNAIGAIKRHDKAIDYNMDIGTDTDKLPKQAAKTGLVNAFIASKAASIKKNKTYQGYNPNSVSKDFTDTKEEPTNLVDDYLKSDI